MSSGSRYTDRAPRYTDHVPYLGLVDWDQDKTRAYAEELADVHKPTRRWFNGHQKCKECETEYPCFAASWANGTRRVRPA